MPFGNLRKPVNLIFPDFHVSKWHAFFMRTEPVWNRASCSYGMAPLISYQLSARKTRLGAPNGGFVWRGLRREP